MLRNLQLLKQVHGIDEKKNKYTTVIVPPTDGAYRMQPTKKTENRKKYLSNEAIFIQVDSQWKPMKTLFFLKTASKWK